MLRYLSVDIIYFKKRTVLKTAIFEEEVMFKDKHSTRFSRQMRPTAFIIFHIVFAAGMFSRVTRLDLSWASENIWQIINNITVKLEETS